MIRESILIYSVLGELGFFFFVIHELRLAWVTRQNDDVVVFMQVTTKANYSLYLIWDAKLFV